MKFKLSLKYIRGLLNIAGPLRIFSLVLVIGVIAFTLLFYRNTAYSLAFKRWYILQTPEAYFYWGKTKCVGEEQYARVVMAPWKNRFNYPRNAIWMDEARLIYRLFKSTMILAGMAGFFTFIWIMLLIFGGISTPIKKNYVLYIDVIFHLIAGMVIITCGICLIALVPTSQESMHMQMDQCLRDMNIGDDRKKIVPYVVKNAFGHKAHKCLDPKSQLFRIIDTILIIVTGLTYLVIGIVQVIVHKFCCCKKRVKAS